MKKEAGNVFGAHNKPVPQNPIVDGTVVQAELSLEIDIETETQVAAMQYWLHPDIAPDTRDYAAADVGDTFDIPTCHIALDDIDEAPRALEILDKALLYIYATHGIDYAKLVRDGDELSGQDVATQTYDSEHALMMAGSFYEICTLLEKPQLDNETIYQAVEAFANFMNFGACEQSASGQTLTMVDMADIDEDDGDLAEALSVPDVCISLDDPAMMTLSYIDAEGDQITDAMPRDAANMRNMFFLLWAIGRARGITDNMDVICLFHMCDMVEQDEPIEVLTQNLVAKKNKNPLHTAAMRAFMEEPAQLVALH